MTEPAAKLETAPAFPVAPPQQPAASADFTLMEMVRFGSIVSAILLLANALVCATWSHFFGVSGWLAWQAVPGALAIAFIPATILRFRTSHPALRVAYTISASWVGALNFAFFAAVGCWMGDGATWITGWPVSRFGLATVLFSLAFLTSVYGVINGRWIRVTRVTVGLPNLPAPWQGRTAALITDLHLGPIFDARSLRKVIARLRLLKPDAVFISGDMFDGSPLGASELVAPWREYSAPQGVYYVTGNHDEFAERSIFIDAVKRTGVRVLNNEKLAVDGLQIVGVHDSEAGHPGELRSILRHVQIDRTHASILLAHRPINLSVAEAEGISLQLSGHTHGGQIWPWNLLVSRIYGPAAAGLSRLGKLQVYTSNGVGTWGPPLRVGTKSEIVLLRFENKS